MRIDKTKLDGVLKITPPTIFEDFRGTYVETYNEELYFEAGLREKFIQDDISVSTRNVLRGIHGDATTGKLVSCLQGKFYLVVVNWDETSSQYAQWESHVISDQNRHQIYIPPKFGNGHLVLTDSAIFHYKQTTNYDQKRQFTIRWNDPKLKIWWPVQDPILSQRDGG